ncbi:MAG: 3-deoxy-D-manno-octulosonate cytidylyltransferase [Candidatus Krumholzibacteriota bacterium]|nr:3-deoxy-D-manno-octulosonate cytidylyltransferase [Candidatus Krumholzibacteriota bacterium]
MPSGFAIVLPARFESTRFPGKPLALIAGRPLIEWVYRRAREVPGAERIIVATDHEGIAAAVRGFGGEAVMTSNACRTGTDRVAEAARGLHCDPIVNLQGDEPIFPVGLVSRMVDVAMRSPAVDIVTACHPIEDEEEMDNLNAVKVVMDGEGRALYFSRSPVPHRAPHARPHGAESDGEGKAPRGYRHIGIYVFRRTALFRFTALPRTPLEVSEGLEQLRALEHGMCVQVVKSSEPTVGVDVPGDVKKVEKAMGGA